MVNAAAWFIRAEVFDRAGGFDPLFFMYGEDDDMLCRWQYHGVAFAFVTDPRVVHLRQSVKAPEPTVWQDIWRRSERHRSELLVAIKRPGFSLTHIFLVGFSQGWLTPLADFLVTREHRNFAASALAAMQVLPVCRQS